MSIIKNTPIAFAAVYYGMVTCSSAQAITYVDADFTNTTIDGAAPVVGTNVTSPARTDSDNLWGYDTSRNWANPNPADGAIWASGDNDTPGELATTITGLTAGEAYNLYCFGWKDGSSWDISAGLTSGSLTGFAEGTANEYSVIGTPTNDDLGEDFITTTSAMFDGRNFTFSAPLEVSEGNRDIFVCSLGSAIANGSGEITVYVGSLAGNGRTWYDGVGFEQASAMPTVVNPPQSAEVILGEDVTFTVSIGSPEAVTYQWQQDGTDIPGATEQSFTFTGALPSDEGKEFTVVATNGSGSVTSAPATISDVTLPAIEIPSQLVFRTFDAEFFMNLTDELAYTYSWSGPGGAIAGATTSSLTVSNVMEADSGTYSVTVGLDGEFVTTTSELTVPPPVADTYTNTVTADEPVAYWRLGESAGVAEAVDQIAPAYNLAIGGRVERGLAGALQNDLDTSMEFDGLDGSSVNAVGFVAELNPAVFTVEAWARLDGGDGRRIIFGSRNIATGAGNETSGYELGVNAAGQWEFRTAQGTENGWNTVTGSPAADDSWTHLVATYDGAEMNLYVGGLPEGNLAAATYVPQTTRGVRIGASGNEETQAQDIFVGGIDEVAIYNRALTAEEALTHFASSVDLSAAPVIVASPQDQGVLIGDAVTFSVNAQSGVAPSYQWRRGGVDIPGETAAQLTIDATTNDDAGNYDVVVTNGAGSVTSDTFAVVALTDYFGTFVEPDATNTILVRDSSATWFGENNAAADAAGLWRQRSVFGIVPNTSAAGYQATAESAGANDGALELQTTITGLSPGSSYAVWTLAGDKAGFTTGIRSGFAGDPIRDISIADTIDTGLFSVSTADPWAVRHAFVGVREADAAGQIEVNFDYLPGSGRVVYNGVGYQLAVPEVAPPLITINPADQTSRLGADVTFTVAANSAIPISYQWQKDNVDIEGATTDSLTIPAVDGEDAGQYKVVVTNTEGATTSEIAYLIPLTNFVGRFVLPDPSNTVLIRDGAAVFSDANAATAQAGGLWFEDQTLSVPGERSSTFGYLSQLANDEAADVGIATTISGLDPNEEYAVWALYASAAGNFAQRLNAGLDGENFRSYDTSFLDTGLNTGDADQFDIYHGLLGVVSPASNGEISVKADFQGLQRTMLLGYGYQTASLPPVLTLEIQDLGDQIQLSYPMGSLEASFDLGDTDPWTAVPGAVSPYDVPKTGINMFFRVAQ